jgi:hypothetical protein
MAVLSNLRFRAGSIVSEAPTRALSSRKVSAILKSETIPDNACGVSGTTLASVESHARGSEPPSQATWPPAPQTIMNRADIEPAASVTGAVVAAVEPFDAEARALAAIVGMPDGKNRCRLSGLQQKACLRFWQGWCQQNEQNEKGDGARDYHSRLPERLKHRQP